MTGAATTAAIGCTGVLTGTEAGTVTVLGVVIGSATDSASAAPGTDVASLLGVNAAHSVSIEAAASLDGTGIGSGVTVVVTAATLGCTGLLSVAALSAATTAS